MNDEFWMNMWVTVLMKRVVYELATAARAPVFDRNWFFTDGEEIFWWVVNSDFQNPDQGREREG